jgi:hypothetical protein
MLGALAGLWTAQPAEAALLSGHFRHAAPGIFINLESQQTATAGPLTDFNSPIGPIAGSYSVDYGTIRLSSVNLGLEDGSFLFSNAGTTARFQDELTVTSPTAAPFEAGTFRARIDLSGSLQASGNGQSGYIVNVETAFFLRQIVGSLYGPLISSNPGIVLGDNFGSYFIDIPFTFGQTFSLSVTGNVDATHRLNQPGSATTNLGNTIRWGGILEVRNQAGDLLPEFSVTSGSGYDYAAVQVVPLPASAWLLLTALGAVGLRARRRPAAG